MEILSHRECVISCCDWDKRPLVLRCMWIFENSGCSIICNICCTKGDTIAGSPPVIFSLLSIMPRLCNSKITAESLSNLNADCGWGLAALEQNWQCALQPLVTFTKIFTCGGMGLPGSSMRLQPLCLSKMCLPKISISIVGPITVDKVDKFGFFNHARKA